MMKRCGLMLLALAVSALQVSSFVVRQQQQAIVAPSSSSSGQKSLSSPSSCYQHRRQALLLHLYSRRRSDDAAADDNDKNRDMPKIPQLPVPGSSSFQRGGAGTSSTPTSSAASMAQQRSSDAAFLTRKFQIQYTCNICETRNCHMVSRLAYREGVVVATCKGCNSKHMIADNLGMSSGGLGGDANIEEYFKTRGMEDSVIRVNREVFDLEKILAVNTKGGSLIGDDGKPVLE